LIKNSHPFLKKFQKITGGIFFTHTVVSLTMRRVARQTCLCVLKFILTALISTLSVQVWSLLLLLHTLLSVTQNWLQLQTRDLFEVTWSDTGRTDGWSRTEWV